MNLTLSPTNDPGLHSVLEGGLAIIRGDGVEGDRRGRILDVLSQMFSEADRGTRVLGAQGLVVTNERPALDSLSLFLTYLSDPYGADFSTRLSEAATVIEGIRTGRNGDEAQKQRASEFIERLLNALHNEVLTEPLVSPTEFRY